MCPEMQKMPYQGHKKAKKGPLRVVGQSGEQSGDD